MQYIVKAGALPKRDMLMTAPVGWPLRGPLLYPYLGAYSYIFISWFIPITLFQWVVWLPAILITLSAIPIFFIGKYLYNENAGILACIFFLFSTSVLSRSLGGDPDSDAIVMLWPMINVALFLLAYKTKDMKNSLIYYILCGFTLALFSYTWPGYWYIYWLLLGFIIVYALVNFILEKKIVKKEIVGFVALSLTLIILGSLYFGIGFIQDVFSSPFKTIGLFTPTGGIKGETREFPNVYVSVAELQTGGTIKDIINHVSNMKVVGSPAVIISPFMLAVYGLIMLGYFAFVRKKYLHSFILLLLWLAGTIFATVVAIRFAIFLAAPVAFSSAIFIAMVYEEIKKRCYNE